MALKRQAADRITTCASDACQVHAVSMIEPRSGKVESGFTVVPTLAVECEKGYAKSLCDESEQEQRIYGQRTSLLPE